MCKGAIEMVAKLLSVQLLLIAAVLAAAAAGGAPTPANIEGGRVVSVEEALRLVSEAGVVFVDVRKSINYGRGHVPGARYVGYAGSSADSTDFDPSQDRFDLTKLPADLATHLTFYSHGDTGWTSYKAAVLSIRAGYTHVSWMRDGFSGWLARGYPLER